MLALATDERDAGDNRTGCRAQDRRLQAGFLATGMIEATPGDEGRPDCKHAAERPKEEPGRDGTQYAKADS